jgi:hypothetical protein
MARGGEAQTDRGSLPRTQAEARPRGPLARKRDGFERGTKAQAVDREHLLDRLQHLRSVVPVFAHELTSARQLAAQLRAENDWLLEQVRQLQRQRPPKPSLPAAPTSHAGPAPGEPERQATEAQPEHGT